MSEPGLYVVATPIGNLEDISPRALRVLSEVQGIAAEDTRRTRKLLRHYGIDTPLLAVHEHNEEQQVPALLARLEAGEALALVSDAGTPLISDPGYRLVNAARERGLPVFAVPGPSALTAALSVAGLPTDRFVFEGFLPARQAARRNRLQDLSREVRTLVFFESGQRIPDLLADLVDCFDAEREVALCRELTKRFETVLRGVPARLAGVIEASPEQRKGEFVVIVAGHSGDDADAMGRAVRLARDLLEFLPASQAARAAAKICGVSRRDVYAALEAD